MRSNGPQRIINLWSARQDETDANTIKDVSPHPKLYFWRQYPNVQTRSPVSYTKAIQRQFALQLFFFLALSPPLQILAISWPTSSHFRFNALSAGYFHLSSYGHITPHNKPTSLILSPPFLRHFRYWPFLVSPNLMFRCPNTSCPHTEPQLPYSKPNHLHSTTLTPPDDLSKWHSSPS
jgi:hypothetical protein